MPENNTPDRFTIIARARSFKYALDGICFLMRTQHNAWLHFAATILVIGAGLILGISLNDWTKLIFAMTLVWAGETINTAFEHLCDVVSPHHNTSVKHAKDIAAGAVLICACGAVLTGLVTLMPYVWAYM